MGLLEDKVVLITGASRGIGKSIAEECVKQGAKVAKYKNITLFPGDNSYKVSGIRNLIKSLNEMVIEQKFKNFIIPHLFIRKLILSKNT